MSKWRRSSSTESLGIRVNPHVTSRSRSSVDNSSPVLVQKGNLTPQSSMETTLSETLPLLSNGGIPSDTEKKKKKSRKSRQQGDLTDTSSGCLGDLDEKVFIDDDDDYEDDVFGKPCSRKDYLRHAKVAIIFMLTVTCVIFLSVNQEQTEHHHQFLIQSSESEVIVFKGAGLDYPLVEMTADGPFLNEAELQKGTDGQDYLHITLFNDTWVLYVNASRLHGGTPVKYEHIFRCDTTKSECSVEVSTNSSSDVAFLYNYLPVTIDHDNDTVYAVVVLVLVYVLITFELVHRTLAALLGSLAALAVLAAVNERPTLEKIVSWIDMETLSLLFGMMILVAIFSETGFFDYSALKAYQIAKGKIWPLITLLCLFSAVVSAFLDNVTTILLLAPVTIRLCEVLNLDPKQILMAEVLFSNIGGTATAIGDPPNVIIVGATSKLGITFSVFTGHAALGIIFVAMGGYGTLRFYYRNVNRLKNQESAEVMELRHEIELWKRTASRVVVATREESVVKALMQQKIAELDNLLSRALHKKIKEERKDFLSTFNELKKKYRITNYPLLIKSGFVLFVVIMILFLHSFITSLHLNLGWIAVLGALLLLVLADISDIETILHRVEWSTLLFFAALFTLMEALAELGLIDTIGGIISDIIMSVNEDSRLLVAILIIVWVSAIASSFIDNIPYTTAMVPVLLKLSENTELNLPLLPMLLCLAFGACLGGNGTLIGASANVVCAGIAEQHGYPISFKEFFVVGFPMMLVTVAFATVYLLICHVALQWNST